MVPVAFMVRGEGPLGAWARGRGAPIKQYACNAMVSPSGTYDVYRGGEIVEAGWRAQKGRDAVHAPRGTSKWAP